MISPLICSPENISAAKADQALKQAVAALEQAENSAVTWFGEILRREVLARDGHRCQAPGCRNTRFLEVHHLRPQARGGDNDPGNLLTLCSACHRLWHASPGVVTRIPSAPRK